jgi:drug/metabolite transporter (DMT)-like permease
VAAVSAGALFARAAEAPALALSFWRCAIAGALLLTWAAPRLRAELTTLTSRERWLALLSGAFLALHFASWITSLEHTTVASSVLLVNTGPIWVGLLSPLVTSDRLSRGAKWGIAVSFLGSALVGGGDLALGREALWGDLLAVIGALAASGYLLAGRRLRMKLSLGVYTGTVYGVAALLLAPAAAFQGAPLVGFSSATWGWILGLALVPQLIGHTAANWALRYASAALVAVSLLGEPILAGLWARVFLGEVPPRAFFLGAPLILAGIFLAARGERRAPEPQG